MEKKIYKKNQKFKQKKSKIQKTKKWTELKKIKNSNRKK